MIILHFFDYTIDSHKKNTNTNRLLNKRTAAPYLIYGEQTGETKKVKKIILAKK